MFKLHSAVILLIDSENPVQKIILKNVFQANSSV